MPEMLNISDDANVRVSEEWVRVRYAVRQIEQLRRVKLVALAFTLTSVLSIFSLRALGIDSPQPATLLLAVIASLTVTVAVVVAAIEVKQTMLRDAWEFRARTKRWERLAVATSVESIVPATRREDS